MLYFSIGNGQARKPALCQLYRRTFVPYLWNIRPVRTSTHVGWLSKLRFLGKSTSTNACPWRRASISAMSA